MTPLINDKGNIRMDKQYTRIAVISDIHGNLQALSTVLEDIKHRGVDKIICLGDIIAKGSHPSECIKLIRDNCDVAIKGNCDRHFTEEYDMEKLPDKERRRVEWNKTLISKDDEEYLKGLSFSYEFYLSGSLVRLFHATPVKDDAAVDVMDSFPDKYEMFLGNENTMTKETADMVVFGHIHHCFAQRFYNRTLLNAGSVGNTHEIIRNDARDADNMETTQAVYLILEGELGAKEYKSPLSWQFVRIPYDIDAELKDSRDNIEFDDFEFELKSGRYRNMEKVNKNLREVGVDVENL